MKSRILQEWKGKVVEVLLEGSESYHLAVLEDYDNEGVYLTTGIIDEMEFDTLIDEGFYFWNQVRGIRPWKPDKEEIKFVPPKLRKHLIRY